MTEKIAENSRDANKYIIFSVTQPKYGVNRIFSILNTVFLEAHRWGRIPVVGNFTVPSSHNLYFECGDFHFNDYFDLARGTLRPRNKVDSVIQDRLKWIKEEELDREAYPTEKVCRIKDEIISRKMHEQYDIIIRRDPPYEYVEKYFQQEKPNLLLDFPYSEKINQLTDIVLKALGTSRENAWATQCYFLNKVATMRSCFDEATRARGSSISLKTSNYACMHVPAKRDSRQKEQRALRFALSKKQIQAVLSYAISKNSRIYIMSDIRNPRHFDFLKEDYQVYRCYDFPELKRLISGENGSSIDNVMLYLVEKNIMKHATVKILPPDQGSIMYHLNEVYDLSILKNPPTGMSA